MPCPKMGKMKLGKRKIVRIAVAIYSVFIAIIVALVMFKVYDPGRNSIEAVSSVCMDVICLIIIFILLGSISFGKYGSNMPTILFGGLLVATIWALFTDFLNWAYDGLLELEDLTFWFTVGSLCMGSVLACILSLYLYSYMLDTYNLKAMRIRARVCAILNIISFVLTFALALSGTAFVFVDGHYEVGALYDVITVLPILTLLYLTGYIIKNVKTIGIHDVLAVAGYNLFMIAGALVEAGNGIGTTYVAVSIADVYIFVMLQNEVIAKTKQNVREWMLKSKTDELTGFYNRHAYEDDIRTLENGTPEENFVYVSVDVNSLKSVNDSLGHSAGDELIVGAAECLKKSLGPYGTLYRIGGDEFIALIFVDSDKIDKVMQEIDQRTKKWKGSLVEELTLSYGYVAWAEERKYSISQLALIADRRMYDNKAEYYRRTGIERRRK